MSQLATAGRMSATEFLTWCLRRDERYELVDGQPRMMTGATRRHDRVVTNAIIALGQRLRGGPCRPTTDDIAVVATTGNVRRPDVTVDCGPVDPAAMTSERPLLVLEVPSPSTAHVDQFEKLEDYKLVETLAYILIAEAGRAHVVAYVRRPDRSWAQVSHIGFDAAIPLPELGCDLKLGNLYEDVPLESA